MKNKLLGLVILFATINTTMFGQENAAPSMHLTYYFPSKDAIVKMQKVKITKSAPTTYFEVNWFRNGYTGLQQTPDPNYTTPNIFISSLWDVNTKDKIYAKLEYNHPTTKTSRFGGEGDGEKTINQYQWQLNNWYNVVNRAWKDNGKLFIATFIQNVSNSQWLHTATISIPNSDNLFLYSENDAFLENWDGTNSKNDGSFERKVFYKDIWNLTPNNTWETNNKTFASVNDSEHDVKRNGKYHNCFNANLDTQENAYFMEHGGSIKPSYIFNGTRQATINLQSNRGTSPDITLGSFLNASVTYNQNNLTVNWEIDSKKTPLLSYNIAISKNGNVLAKFTEVKPEARSKNFKITLPDGTYNAEITGVDIFNQNINSINKNFSITNGGLINSEVSKDNVKLKLNVLNNSIKLESNKNFTTYKIVDSTGKTFLRGNVLDKSIDISTLKSGKYYIKLDNYKLIAFTKK